MDNTVEAVRGYYDENARLEWERLEKHPFEFLLTTGRRTRCRAPRRNPSASEAATCSRFWSRPRRTAAKTCTA